MVMLSGILSLLLFNLMIGVLLDVLIEFGLVVSNIFFVVLFLFDQMAALVFDLVDEVLLLFDSLLISFLEVLNSFL